MNVDTMPDLRTIFESDLRGHAYVAARGLSPEIIKDQQHRCDSCKQMEMLPAVLNIINAERKRRKEMREQIRRIA